MDLANHYAGKLSLPVSTVATSATFFGEAPYVGKWDEEVLGPRPEQDEIDALAAEDEPGPSTEDLLAYAMHKQNASLSEVWSFDVGAKDAPVLLTTRLDDSGQAAVLQLLIWGKVLAGPKDVQHYNLADGMPGPDITPDQAVSLAMQAGAVKSASYKTLNDVAAAITASSPTIVSFDDIDKAAWPMPA